MSKLNIEIQIDVGRIIAMKATDDKGNVCVEAGMFFREDGESTKNHTIEGSWDFAEAIATEIKNNEQEFRNKMR